MALSVVEKARKCHSPTTTILSQQITSIILCWEGTPYVCVCVCVHVHAHARICRCPNYIPTVNSTHCLVTKCVQTAYHPFLHVILLISWITEYWRLWCSLTSKWYHSYDIDTGMDYKSTNLILMRETSARLQCITYIFL